MLPWPRRTTSPSSISVFWTSPLCAAEVEWDSVTSLSVQGVVLKLPVTDQIQKDVTNTNRSCWSSPHSILWCKTTWFRMFDVQNHTRISKTVIKITDPHHRMDNLRKMGLVVSRDDHLVVHRVHSHCTWVNNVIQHEFSWTGPQICDHWWLKWVI